MNFPYAPRLDSRVVVTGTYNPGSGTTSFEISVGDDTINAIVLGNAFGAAAGAVLTPLDASTATEKIVDGQFTLGPCILGRLYTMRVELSRPYRRDQRGLAIVTDRLQVTRIQTSHTNTGAYTIRASMPNRTDRTRTFAPPTGTLIEEAGHFRTMLNGDTRNMRVFLENSTAKPCQIASVEYAVEVSKGAGS